MVIELGLQSEPSEPLPSVSESSLMFLISRKETMTKKESGEELNIRHTHTHTLFHEKSLIMVRTNGLGSNLAWHQVNTVSDW